MDGAYEMVIGLEVHVELKTHSKIFCGCKTAFGAAPNTQCCPVCMGMPGTLPVLNEQAVHFAVKAGLATHCGITRYGKQDRKNYFYPDLPKAYQISQYDLPLCTGGYLDIEAEGEARRISITRIHIEEDAGKLLHSSGGSLIDYNRCGVPLIEIVSEPDMRSAAQAKAYLQNLRAVMMYLDISDAKMNEGSFRCDVNLSVRKRGEQALGTRTETKNLNSFQHVAKAIEYEANRQVECLKAGHAIVQETRRFDVGAGATASMRTKENAQDYRYFPDPDLMPIAISDALIDALTRELPALPEARKRDYMENFGLSAYDAQQLVTEREISDYFDAAVDAGGQPKAVANLMLSEIFRLLPPETTRIPISPAHIAELATIIERGEINSSAAKRALQIMWQSDERPSAVIAREDLSMVSDADIIRGHVREVLTEHAELARDFIGGKVKVLEALIGMTMRKTRGKGNPECIREQLLAEIHTDVKQ